MATKNRILWAVEADLGNGYELIKADAAWRREDAREYRYLNVSDLLNARVRKYVPAEIQHN
jgi:hypothetical protein